LISDDQAPNTNGCRLLAFDETDAGSLQTAAERAEIIIALNDDLIGREVLSKNDIKDKLFISFSTNMDETAKAADLVIPITCAAEHNASYINVDGRIQRTYPAKETKYSNRRIDLEMSEGRLDRFGTSFDNWVNADNKVDCLPVWEFLNNLAERIDLNFQYHKSRSILAEVTDTFPAFENVTYEQMDEQQGVQLSIENNLDKVH